MHNSMKRHSHFCALLAFAGVATLILIGCSCTRSEDNTRAHQGASTSTVSRSTLRDGLYPVLWEAATPESANLVAPQRLVLPYDRKYTGLTEREPRTYLAIDTSSSVPLILEGQPEARQDGTGRALLSVTLAREQVAALERFTTKHLGDAAAIILDGEVITMHKVRSVIRDGKVQISRCDSGSCEVLRGRLAE